MRVRDRLPDLIGVSGVLIGLISIAIAAAIDDGGTLGNELFESVTAIGASRVALATVVVMTVLGYMAGGRRRGVLAVAFVLIVGVGLYTSGRFDQSTHYPPEWGTERQGLQELAADSPNSKISTELAGLIRLGEVLGHARLIVPGTAPVARLRAFTDLDVESATVPETDLDLSPARELAGLGEEGLFLVGDGLGEAYYWVDTADGVYVVPAGLMESG